MSSELVPVSRQDVAQRFEAFPSLSVRQQKRWFEILLSFEARNRYDVYSGQTQVLTVQEQGGGFVNLLKRLFLGPLRPFEAYVSDSANGALLLKILRPFRFFFGQIAVQSGAGEPLGRIERKWSFPKSCYTIYGAEEQVVAEIVGPFFKPWTFEIKVMGRDVGVISKKWSGLGKELFSDADNFGVKMDTIEDPKLRALVFAATVLIDVVHFERSKNG